jgi:hypothetical protein
VKCEEKGSILAILGIGYISSRRDFPVVSLGLSCGDGRVGKAVFSRTKRIGKKNRPRALYWFVEPSAYTGTAEYQSGSANACA